MDEAYRVLPICDNVTNNSSCPALCRASPSCLQSARKTWMAGSSPAMTKESAFD
jgi:hypothetical protein